MKKHWFFTSLTLLVVSAAMILLSGCNTWHGAGRDIERTGEKMQHN